VYTEFILLKVRTSSRSLWTMQWTFGFHKMLGISSVAEQLISFPRIQIYGVS
jgi:hypothetical protein